MARCFDVVEHTKRLLDEWRNDIKNPLRAWGEMDCLIELKILEEQMRTGDDMPHHKSK